LDLNNVSLTLEPLITAALGELTGERMMEVLPVLQNLSLDEPEPSGPARGSKFSLENKVFKPNFFYSQAKCGNISMISLQPLPN
jgi:hypothetical protein